MYEGLREGGSAEPLPTGADALAVVADLALSGRGRTGGERYQVVVHIDEPTLSAAQGGCELAEGPALAPETARRLACDSSVVEMLEREGETLSMGRKNRTIPPALRRALRRRDRGCRFPGCENHRFVDAHHVHHWALGGETKLDNLVLLCRSHHRLVHEGGYRLAHVPEGDLLFSDPCGRPLRAVSRPPPGSLEGLLENNRTFAINGETYRSGPGDRLDLGMAVEALLAARPP